MERLRAMGRLRDRSQGCSNGEGSKPNSQGYLRHPWETRPTSDLLMEVGETLF